MVPAAPREQLPLLPLALAAAAGLHALPATGGRRARALQGAAVVVALLAVAAGLLLYTVGRAPLPVADPPAALAALRLHYALQGVELLLLSVAALLLVLSTAGRGRWSDPASLLGYAGVAVLLAHAALLGLLAPPALLTGADLPGADDVETLLTLQRTLALGPALLGAAFLARALLGGAAPAAKAPAAKAPRPATTRPAPRVVAQPTRCPGCGHAFTLQRNLDAPTPVACPQCGKRGVLPPPASRPPG